MFLSLHIGVFYQNGKAVKIYKAKHQKWLGEQ